MKMDIGNYEHIEREPRRRSFPEELREYSEEDETRKADSDKVALLFILQTFFALVLTSALVLASNGYLGDVEGVLPDEDTDDVAVRTLSDICGKYFPKADSVEDALSSILPDLRSENNDEEENSQPQEESEEEVSAQETANLLSSKSAAAPSLLRSSLSGELAVPAHATLFPIVTTAQAISPLADWDTVSVSSQFGYRTNPLTGKVEFHSGIDIPSPHGTAIRSVYPGTVIESGYSDVFGNYIVLEHTGGTRTRYCHCSRIAAANGARVRSGETIAYVGSTGVSTGSHLHLDLIVNGLYADPLWLFDLPNR